MATKLLKIFGIAGVVAGLGISSPALASELDKVVFGTNWYAQAEHGGFYQAVAAGIYEEHGLDVEIKMGGPQVNGTQLLVSGRYDLLMGYPIGNINAVAKGLPVVTVAAAMQGDPQAIIAHPNIKSIEEIKEKELPVYVAAFAHSTFWPWLKSEYGFTDEVVHAYTFSVAPFLNNERIVQQGYLSSEPFAMRKGGVEPSVFLLSDYGYPPYATTIETTHGLVEENPDLVRRFVQASMEGWKSYLENPGPGNRLIQEANPEMTDEQIAYGIEKMKEYELVTGGDAATLGIGVMTDERWQKIYDFMVEAELAPDDMDLSKAYTLEFLPDEPVLP
ncbi:ABC transporter substrate-binding protein [Hydrocarboniclastica marina]|uniref:ABC transporter substrate-binding protein n=1 Tax=Hydrocarboniclastica marina TaxID=2259620 RepID=A0A4P7XLX6_9ALTE|nr:ABC transporter substrate-binding protein [Hydrocarboniclastica marina]MAM00122.1 nitrate ABC transporter substrate-binding protein [Alteromonadaceae bacterium]QCF27432.1 ABC transporter substrate-binding protein [Hydrocarboniclastica marina]